MLENLQPLLAAFVQSMGLDATEWKVDAARCAAAISKIPTENAAHAINDWLIKHGFVTQLSTSSGRWTVSATSLKYTYVYNPPARSQ